MSDGFAVAAKFACGELNSLCELNLLRKLNSLRELSGEFNLAEAARLQFS